MAFRLFNHIDQVDVVERAEAAKDFFTLLTRLQEAAKIPPWALYPNFVDYAKLCFWAIRKHEYSFIAESFAQFEVQAARPLNVLDVGCGVVPMCNWISSRGHRVTALDSLQADIEFLNRTDLNAYYQSHVAYHLSRAEHLAFADATFDVVTCVSVLEHITPGNDLLALWEIARVLKPGGTLLITFDVSPDPIESSSADVSLEHRAFAAPFTMKTAADLFEQIAPVFEVSPEDVPAELATLTWKDVYAQWTAVQQHDQREIPLRHYLAMGALLKRRPNFIPLSQDQITLAYLRGEAALESRVAYFEHHATQRLKYLEEFQQREALFQERLETEIPEKKTFGETFKNMFRK